MKLSEEITSYLVYANIYEDEGFYKKYLWVERNKIKEILPSPLSFLPILDYSSFYLLPAFIDSHTHLLGVGLSQFLPNLDNAESLDDVFDIILTKSKNFAGEQLLLAFNFDLEKIKEKRYPTIKELDKVLKNKPLIINQKDGHTCLLNTKAIELIFEDQKELPDGLELDDYQMPTGVVKKEAKELVDEFWERNLSRDLKILSYKAATELAYKEGVTILCAMVGSNSATDDTAELLLELSSSLPIDVIIFYQTTNCSLVKKLGLNRIGGCILVDGSLTSHTAALSFAYHDQKETNGILYFSDEELTNFLKEAAEEELQTAVHAIGDRAIEQVVRCYEKFLTKNELRHRIEHAEILRPDLIKRIKNLDLILSVQPTFELFWGGEDKLYEKRLGERIKLTNPYQTLLNEGVILAGGSDAPITPINPLLGIYAAMNHPNPEERITFSDALKMFTINGAYAIFKEDEVGKLKPNYRADFCLLDENPMVSSKVKVKGVFKSGKCLFLDL